MTMTEQEAKALAVLKLFGKDDDIPKLEELIKARQDNEAVLAQITEQREKLEADTQSSIAQIKKEKDDFDKAKVAHDESAEEARKRINLNRSQQSELDALKAEVDKKHESLALREAQVAQDLKRVQQQSAQLSAAIEYVSKLKPALAEVASITQSMKEALG